MYVWHTALAIASRFFPFNNNKKHFAFNNKNENYEDNEVDDGINSKIFFSIILILKALSIPNPPWAVSFYKTWNLLKKDKDKSGLLVVNFISRLLNCIQHIKKLFYLSYSKYRNCFQELFAMLPDLIFLQIIHHLYVILW